MYEISKNKSYYCKCIGVWLWWRMPEILAAWEAVPASLGLAWKVSGYPVCLWYCVTVALPLKNSI